MGIEGTPGAHPMLAALAGIGEALDAAGDAAVWSLGSDDLLAAVEATERLAARLAGLQLRLLAEVDARGVASELGAPSTAALLRERLLLHPREAKARVRLANNPDLAGTRAALGAGDITAGHARVIGQAVRRLPAPTRADAEAFLLDQATTFDPARLDLLARHLRYVADPDAAGREEQSAAGKRELISYDRGDGTHALRAILPNEDHARLMAALDPLAAPQPMADGTADPRTPAQRRYDALLHLITRRLDTGDLPIRRGARPHVHITAGLDTLLNLPGAPAADLSWGGPVSAETLRRIACDADVSLLLLDQHGVPLHVGRQHRTVTPGIWAALLARDRGCAFPGCTRPASWTEAHHVIFWADGGPTALHNLVLLCAYHHDVVHHNGWDIRFADDGHPEFLPPPWIDAERKPRRNTYWRSWRPDPPPSPP